MDSAALGSTALSANNFPSAISHYSNAISTNPHAVDYYIKRSMAHARTSPSDYGSSLHDAEIAVVLATKRAKRELIAESQLRRGVALYGLQRWGDARECFKWAGDFNYDEKVLRIWESKIGTKLKELVEGDEKGKVIVKEIPEVEVVVPAAATVKDKDTTKSVVVGKTARVTSSSGSTQAAEPEKRTEEPPPPPPPLFSASKIRYDWYQSTENVVVSLFAKGIPKDQVTINLHPTSLQLSFPTTPSSSDDGPGPDFEYKLDALFAEIDPVASTSKITSAKIELTLRKAASGLKWAALENQSLTDTNNNDFSSSSLPQTSQQQQQQQQQQNPSSSLSSSSTTVFSPLPSSKPNKPTPPAYPTSSKTGPKDWDKLADSFAKKPKPKQSHAKSSRGRDTQSPSQPKQKSPKTKKSNNADDDSDSDVVDDDDGIDYDMDGGDEVGAFFKQIYKGASPDAQRAMMKSYQESNGTALSTNWDEVGKGKVETVPPAGMEVRKW